MAFEMYINSNNSNNNDNNNNNNDNSDNMISVYFRSMAIVSFVYTSS